MNYALFFLSITFFSCSTQWLVAIEGWLRGGGQQQQQHNPANIKIISDLIQGFKTLLAMVEKNNVSYNEVVKNYIMLLEKTFGKKYSDYAKRHYKL